MKKNGRYLICGHCGNEFYASGCRVDIAKYCSNACYHKASRKEYKKICVGCGVEFDIKPKHFKTRKYCSSECFNKHRRNSPPKKTKGKDGYIYLWLSDGSGIKEHRHIMEQHLGRKLLKTEHVHHIDFSRDNNSLDNLVVLTREQHSKLHREHEIRQGKPLFGRYCDDKQQAKRETRRA